MAIVLWAHVHLHFDLQLQGALPPQTLHTLSYSSFNTLLRNPLPGDPLLPWPLLGTPLFQAQCTTYDHPLICTSSHCAGALSCSGQVSLSRDTPTDRLPEGQENLATQHMEEVAGRGAVDNHPVAVVQLVYIEVGFIEVLQRGGQRPAGVRRCGERPCRAPEGQVQALP